MNEWIYRFDTDRLSSAKTNWSYSKFVIADYETTKIKEEGCLEKKASLLKPSDILFIIGTRSWTRMRRRLILLRVRTARTRLLLCAARAKSIYSLSNGIFDTVWPVPLFLEDGDILGS